MSDLPTDDANDDAANEPPAAPPPAAESKNQTAKLVALLDDAELFLADGDGIAHASLLVDGTWQTWPLRSSELRGLLIDRAVTSLSTVPADSVVASALAILDARARRSGIRRAVAVRVHGDASMVWLDLGDHEWRTLRIDSSGRRVEKSECVRFVRGANTEALPHPIDGGSIEEFRSLLNVDDDSFALVVGFLLAALRPKAPYPILALTGEQGSGKSTATRFIRALVDPARAATRSMPTGGSAERDLFISARRQWIMAFDNISKITPRVSDALCRITDGGSFATRALYTDSDEAIFTAARPLILNGIESVVERPDLLDRTLLVELQPIADHGTRRSHDQLVNRFDQLRPRLLGSLLDGVSSALSGKPTVVDGDEVTRLIDVERWVSAAEAGIGWNGSRFHHALRNTLPRRMDVAIEASNLATALIDFLDSQRPRELGVVWSGTMTQLRDETAFQYYGDASSIGKLGNITPLLRARGYAFRKVRSPGGTQRITVFTRHERHGVTERDT